MTCFKPTISLFDPEIKPLARRIHHLLWHDWAVDDGYCGSCFDVAFDYIATKRLLESDITPVIGRVD